MAQSAFKGARRSRLEPLDPELLSVPYANVEDDPTLWQGLKGTGLGMLHYAATTINKPSRALWGSLDWLAGGKESGGGLLNILPFSDTLGLTDPSKGVELSQFLINRGVVPENDPTKWEAGDFLRFGLDILGDPTTYLGPGALGKAASVGKAAGVLDDAVKGSMKALGVGKRVAAMRTTLREALDRGGAKAWEAAGEHAAKNGIDLTKLADQPLGKFATFGGFGKFLEFGSGKGWEKAAALLDMPWEMFKKTPIWRGARALFDYKVRGATSAAEQAVQEGVTSRLQEAHLKMSEDLMGSDEVIRNSWAGFQKEFDKMNPRQVVKDNLAVGDAVNAAGRYGEIVGIDPSDVVTVRHVDPETGRSVLGEYGIKNVSSAIEDIDPQQLIDAAAAGSNRARVMTEAMAVFGENGKKAVQQIDRIAARWSQATGLDSDNLFSRMSFEQGTGRYAPRMAAGAGRSAIVDSIKGAASKRDLEDWERALGGNAMGIEGLPKELADKFDAHGATLDDMMRLLDEGIDNSMPFHTAKLSDPSGGVGLRSFQPFMAVSKPGKTLKDGIGSVIVDPLHSPNIPDLQRMYPDVNFIPGDDIARGLERASTAKPFGRGPGIVMDGLKSIGLDVGRPIRTVLSEFSEELAVKAEKALGVKDFNWTDEAEDIFADGLNKYVAGEAVPKALKEVYDDLLNPKAVGKGNPERLLAQSRKYAAFNKLATAFAEGQDIAQAVSQVRNSLGYDSGTRMSKTMLDLAESAGKHLSGSQDQAYSEFLAMGGKGGLMGVGKEGEGTAKHFARFVSEKVAKETPKSAEEFQTFVGKMPSRTFGGAQSRNPVTRDIHTNTVNEMLSDPALRDVDNVLEELEDKYISSGKVVLDKEWKNSVPMEELTAGTQYKKLWKDAVKSAGTSGANLDEVEQTIRQAIHLEDIADYITSHKYDELYTRDKRADHFTYISGLRNAQAAMGAVHDAVQDAMGEGTVSLAKVYQRAGMNPDAALEFLSMRTGKTVDSLSDLAVPEELANAIAGTMMAHGADKTLPGWHQMALDAFDKMTRIFKAGVTVLPINPAFFVRNGMSGHFMNISSGLINTPADYLSYIKALGEAATAAKGNGKWVDEIQSQWVGRNMAYAGDLAKEDAIAIGRTGPEVLPPNAIPTLKNLKDRYQEAMSAIKAEPSILDAVPGKTARKNLAAAWTAAVGQGQDMNAWVEWTNRVPMYIYLRKKGWAPSAAMSQVDRLHLDYGALSPFEKTYMKRLVPFYGFSRRMAETVATDVLNRPGGMLAQFVRRSAGNTSDISPDIPDHILDTLAIEVSPEDPSNRRFVTGLGLPYEDLTSFGGMNPLQELLSRSNPILKAPIEWGTGRTFFQGRALEDADPVLGRILANVTGQDDPVQLPLALEHFLSNSPLSRVLTAARTLTEDSERKGAMTKAINLLSGIKITDVSERSRDAVLQDRVTKFGRKYGAKLFERPYFKKDEQGKLTPEQTKLNDVLRALAARAKAAKKKKETEAGKR